MGSEQVPSGDEGPAAPLREGKSEREPSRLARLDKRHSSPPLWLVRCEARAGQACWPSKLVDPLLSLEHLSWFARSTPQGGSAVEAGCMLDQRRAPHFSPRYPPSPDRADLKLTSRNAAPSLTSSCLNAREIGQAWRSFASEQTIRPAAALTPVPRLDRGSRSPGALTASPLPRRDSLPEYIPRNADPRLERMHRLLDALLPALLESDSYRKRCSRRARASERTSLARLLQLAPSGAWQQAVATALGCCSASLDGSCAGWSIPSERKNLGLDLRNLEQLGSSLKPRAHQRKLACNAMTLRLARQAWRKFRSSKVP
ncbi:hypothetical protein AAT19DRAFT_16832 [Rhodotorula toruloides]|uniref:Uncharacterized protein n=1 Tax=Rhodotorula toruloides TaxID=5286 RepID=A0A2T0A4G2_RHOTO|nr:hypothetical protein AAT19DRAFT_16832 [Rhodotorula toruloides]